MLVNNATRGYAKFGLKNQKSYVVHGIDWSNRMDVHDKIFRDQESVFKNLSVPGIGAATPYSEVIKMGSSPSFPFPNSRYYYGKFYSLRR